MARLLERCGLAVGAESCGVPDLWSEEASVLAAAATASVEGRLALGPRAGARVRPRSDPPEEVAPMTPGPCHAHVAGFDLHAGLVTRAGERDRLERLCRYALRPPLAQDRLHVSDEGEMPQLESDLRCQPRSWKYARHLQEDLDLDPRLDPPKR